ncbi:MAG: TlpA family protein disulfide reductase [Candidatus Latescibacterota bacterium]|nr:MAG: TlpA family protein disulfide reductase [Candidatus Latescibacterota bacterium]
MVFMQSNRFLTALAAPALAIALVIAFPAPVRAAEGVDIGGTAPDFTLQDLDGKSVNLAKLLAKGPVLLDFWALWCKPCLQALPATDDLSRRYAEKGLTVLAINTDQPRSTAKVRSYVKSKGFSFEVLLDPNSDMQRLYRFSKIPQLFLVSPEGKIVFSKLGYVPGQEKLLEEEIAKLLPAAGAKEAAPASETGGSEAEPESAGEEG